MTHDSEQADNDEKDFAVIAASSMIGHNGGPALPPNYDPEPSTQRWIAISTDMRFHHLVGCGQPVKPDDPSRGSWSRYEAWQDLICEATWKNRKAVNKGKTILLERGQLMASRGWLAKRWNWTEKQVRGWLLKLENETMLEMKSGQQKGQQKQNLVSIVTICNYNIYQTAREIKNLLEGQQKVEQRASEGPAQGQPAASEGPDLVQGNKGTKERERESDGSLFPPPQAAATDGDKLYVNGVKISGPGFSLAYDSIDLIADRLGRDREETRADAAIVMRGWVENEIVVKDPFLKLNADLKALKAGAAKVRNYGTLGFENPNGPDPAKPFFWELYPYKIGKGHAFDVWSKMTSVQRRKAYNALVGQLENLKAQKARFSKDGRCCCPHAATWLNEGRWDDDPVEAPPAPVAPAAKSTYSDFAKDRTLATLNAMLKPMHFDN